LASVFDAWRDGAYTVYDGISTMEREAQQSGWDT